MMPHRLPSVIPKIPLFLPGPVVRREAKKAGKALVRIVIREMKRHLFDISAHTRAMCRCVFQFRPILPEMDTEPRALSYCAAVADP